MPRIRPKNWAAFQHYKDRSPPWIKLHKSLLDDYEFQCLHVASRALAPMLWLLASEDMEGWIDIDGPKLPFRLRMSVHELNNALEPLIDAGFFERDSKVLAQRKRSAMPEERRGETQVENHKLIEAEESAAIAASKQGTRWLSDRIVPKDWIAAGHASRSKHLHPSADLETEAEKFANYWSSKSGKDGTKLDWKKTWINWALTAKGVGTNGSGKNKPTAHDNFIAGAAALIDDIDAGRR